MTEPSEPFDDAERARRRPEIELPGPDWDGWTPQEPSSPAPQPQAAATEPWAQQPAPAQQAPPSDAPQPWGNQQPPFQQAPPAHAQQPWGNQPPYQQPQNQQAPAGYAPGQYPPAQAPPGHYPPGQYPPPDQYPQGFFPEGQYPQGQYPEDGPPGSYPANQYQQVPGGVAGYDIHGKRLRPWWGLGDVLLSIPFILLIAIAGTFAGVIFLNAEERDSLLNGTSTPAAVLAIGLIFQQLAQLVWPFIVSKWKGLGAVIDWRLKFKPIDIAIGLGVAIGVLIVVTILGAILSTLISEETLNESENTSFLTDAEGTPWLYVLIFGAVIGAPVVEEIFFRGLTMRAFEKRFKNFGERKSQIAAVIGSTVVFVIPHFTGAGLVPTLILFATIAVVGAVLGVVTFYFDRLGPAIVAHMVFNGVGVTAALLTTSSTPLTELFRPILGL